MAYYKDLRELLKSLEEKGKLIRIKRKINKDTELMPLARLQFRGLPEEERKGFMFENITDAKGKKYDIPLVVGVIAASRDIYAIGMNCDSDKITEKWSETRTNPIEPIIVNSGPVQEVVHIGDSLLEHGGLEEFPIQISTPGYDSGPFITCPYVVTKDPETGIPNVGMYRAHVKSPTRTGVQFYSVTQHGAMHLAKAAKMGKPLETAIVIGGPPCLGYVAVTRLPYEVNEFAYASAIAGEPLEMVKCKSIDLEVPAHAEIVIEGLLSTDEIEPEAPFGEAGGYVGKRDIMPYLTVTGITHRKNPIYQAILSQYPPQREQQDEEHRVLKWIVSTLENRL
ncbi:UbiD family decarboxylase [Chloroflexota bacterium]